MDRKFTEFIGKWLETAADERKDFIEYQLQK
jgi:hypothetical protein